MDVSISESQLRAWYEQELLTESEIASQVGMSQVQVGRLRKRFGIPTISRDVRTARKYGMPDTFTPEQEALLVGSLLGDGCLRPVGTHTARFTEGHSDTQREYTLWKAKLLDPFTAGTCEVSKTDRNGKTHFGLVMQTRACSILRPWYDLFYPAPERKKVFPKSLPELISPLALAVWFMDDGSVASGGHNASIAFGLDDKSLEMGLKALRKLGIKASVTSSSGSTDKTLHILGQTNRFLSLIKRHVPPCMQYKLPAETVRQAKNRKSRIFSAEDAHKLVDSGLSLAQVSEIYDGVSQTTIRRKLRAAGFSKIRPGPKTRASGEHIKELLDARYPDTSLWGSLPQEDQEYWSSDILECLRKTSFPFPKMLSVERILEIFAKDFSSSTDLPGSSWGLAACYPFFPNRYHARYKGKDSAFVAWHDDIALVKAIQWQLRYGNPVTPSRVLRAVTANSRTPTIFKPAVAKELYDRYGNRGVVWDPCMGFGGRLFGAMKSGVRYIGTDVAEQTLEGNQQLALALGKAEQVDLHLCPAENFVPPPVDMVFTSPPYFHQERYAGGTQSWQQYRDFDSWVAGFLLPVVHRGAASLVPGGYWVMNIADVQDGRRAYPLVQAACQALDAAGLEQEAILEMPLSMLNRGKSGEPVLVFRKRPSST